MALTFDVGSVNPYGNPNPSPSGFDMALKNAGLIGDLFAKRYQNQQEAAKARLINETLEGEIASKNATNEADRVYYPLMQAAKLQQERAQIKEIQARTGVSYAQAKHYLNQAEMSQLELQAAQDPAYQLKQINNQIANAAPGTPEFRYYNSLRNALLVGAGNVAMTGTLPSAGKGGAAIGSMFPSKNARTSTGMAAGGTILPGGFMTNPMQGNASRSGYKQAATVDEQGNPITVESPTPASASVNQRRMEAEKESQFLNPHILAGVNNYQSMFPTAQLMMDNYIARGKGKAAEAAKKRLEDYIVAQSLIPEAAAIAARQATGSQPGIELLREFIESRFSGVPKRYATEYAPADVKKKAAERYAPLQEQMAQKAIDVAREGYPVQGQPLWARAETQELPYDEQGNYRTPEQLAEISAQRAQQGQQQKQARLSYLQQKAQAAINAGKDPALVKQKLMEIATQEGLIQQGGH